MTPLSAPQLARAVVAGLIDAGIRQVVLCPGSRSAPLAYALADAERCGHLQVLVRIDERVAGFTALGLTKADPGHGRPAAVVTTSGTATANLHPAIVEAAAGNWPLIAITADRPPELHGIGANQTCDQNRLYGDAVRAFCQLEAPKAGSGAGAGVRGQVLRAVACARGRLPAPGTTPGPVQVNVSLRDPLAESSTERSEAAQWWRRYRPLADEDTSQADAAGSRPWGSQAERHLGTDGSRTPADEAFEIPDDGRLGLVIAGDDAPQARAWAEASGWPLVAEPSSGALGSANAIGAYRLLLSGPWAQRIGRVVVFGRPTLSRPISALMNRADVEVVVCRRPQDPPVNTVARDAHIVRRVVPARANPELGQWIRAGQAAYQVVVESAETSESALRLALACWRPGALAAAPTMMVGASNTVRDLDLTIPLRLEPPRIVANRGLAGIDGTISTATGLACGTGQAVRAIVGDLTLLHDAGGLSVPRGQAPPPVQIVCANDGGGSIFATLEHGQPQHAADFEKFFATGQQVDLAALAAAYGWAYRRIDDIGELDKVLAAPITNGLVDVVIDRRGRHREEAELRVRALKAAAKLG